MAAARTPGFWAVFRDHPTCQDVAFIRPANSDALSGNEIAVIYGGGVEKRQQAQLLAEAPALLKALQDLLAAVNVRIDDPRIALFDAARALVVKVDPDAPLSPAWCASVDAELAATAEADAALTDIQVQAVRDAVAEALGNAYDCTRVWSAWGVGTMDQDDFQLVAEDSDRVAEIADAAIAAMRAPAPAITLPAAAVAEGMERDGDALEQAS